MKKNNSFRYPKTQREKVNGLRHYVFEKEIKLPFKNPYDQGLVGEDRLSLILGAYSMYPQDNVLVVDLGTCITYDIKTSENIYQAGGISPGLGLRKKSLY